MVNVICEVEIPKQKIKAEHVLKDLDEKDKEMDSLIAPDGSRKFPAKTCYDLFLDHGNFESVTLYFGEFYLFFFSCAKQIYLHQFHHSPLFQISDLVLKSGFESKEDKWLSKAFKKSEEVEYDAHYTQINFLRTLSNYANQNVTYACRNSKAWEDGQHSIKLMGSNDMEYHASSKISLRPTVIMNECADGGTLDKWGKTVLEIDTRERSRLPIVDVSAFDVGREGQDFKLEIGPACFHHIKY
ncbi:PREDICTED: collagen alpha chain-like [Acropora digitifera]|uniref:collagen alpha chain-like n=1 Tax=Acropora digitifera TaxID=70779 RepID=UPI00077A16CC|nr:PREDICTED: collagen alpha chain-like [Acropora digitifera]